MFKDSRALDVAHTAASFAAAYQRYADQSEKWFDGSINSVDRRLVACDRLLHGAKSTVARLSGTESARYLRAAQALRNDQESVSALREALLTGAADYPEQSPPGFQDYQDTVHKIRHDKGPHSLHEMGEHLMAEPSGYAPVASRSAGNWFAGDPSQYNMNPNDYSSQQEWMNANNLGGYLQDQSQQHPGAGEPAVPSLEQSMTRADKAPVDPTVNVSVPRNLPRADAGPGPGHDYAGGAERTEPSPEGVPGSRAGRLAGTDARWVTLESAKFVQASIDILGDPRELAIRAHNYAALKTSALTPAHSSAVCAAFVQRVVELGRKTYRPAPRRVAAIDVDFDPQAIFVC